MIPFHRISTKSHDFPSGDCCAVSKLGNMMLFLLNTKIADSEVFMNTPNDVKQLHSEILQLQNRCEPSSSSEMAQMSRGY